MLRRDISWMKIIVVRAARRHRLFVRWAQFAVSPGTVAEGAAFYRVLPNDDDVVFSCSFLNGS